MSETALPILIDISPPLSPQTAVWPGDHPLFRHHILDIHNGAHLDLSTLQTTVHIGAHTDAHSHVDPAGNTIDQAPLSAYLGPCSVLSVTAIDGLVRLFSIEHVLENLQSRVIFRTNSFPHYDRFNEDFAGLEASVIEALADQGAVLVGIDTPSLDPFASKSLDAHHAMVRRGLVNLEGLILQDVEDGDYELIALPLRLIGFDASPVRAVLKRYPSS